MSLVIDFVLGFILFNFLVLFLIFLYIFFLSFFKVKLEDLNQNYSTTFDELQKREFLDGEYSGLLYSEKNIPKNFISVPARFNFQKNGDILVTSKIDALNKNEIWTFQFGSMVLKNIENADLEFDYHLKQSFGLKIEFENGSISILNFYSQSDKVNFFWNFPDGP